MKEPLSYTTKDFADLQGKVISIKFKAPKESIWVAGRISNIICASNPPNEVAFFDFTLTKEAKIKAVEKGIEIPVNITPFEIEEIDSRLEYSNND